MLSYLREKFGRLQYSIANFEEDPSYKKDDDALPVHYRSSRLGSAKEEESEEEDEFDEILYQFQDPETKILLHYEWEELPVEVKKKLEMQKQNKLVSSNGSVLDSEQSGIAVDDDGEEFDVDLEDGYVDEDSEDEILYDNDTDTEDEEDEIEEEKFIENLRQVPSARISYLSGLYKTTKRQGHSYCFRDLIANMSFVDNVCFIPIKNPFIILLRASMDPEYYDDISKSKMDVDSYMFAYDSTEIVMFAKKIYEEIRALQSISDTFVALRSPFQEFLSEHENKNGYSVSPQVSRVEIPQEPHKQQPVLARSQLLEHNYNRSPITPLSPIAPIS